MRKIILLLLTLGSLSASSQIVGLTGDIPYVRKITVLTDADSLFGIDNFTGRNFGSVHKYQAFGNGFDGVFRYGQSSMLYRNGTELGNIGLGKETLRDNTGGDYNVAVGYGGLLQMNGGDYNLAIGPFRSLWSQTTGNRNIGIGYYVDVFNLTGSDQMNIANAIYGNGVNNTTGSTVSTGNIGIFVNNPSKNLHVNGTYRHTALGPAAADSGTYKPLVINSAGDIVPFNRWAGAGGSGTIDATPTNGSTNAISSDAVFDGLLLKANVANLVATGTATIPIIQGGTGSGNLLTLTSTSNATKGKIYLNSAVMTPITTNTGTTLTITYSHSTVICNTATGNQTLTLPTATAATNVTYTFKKNSSDANTVTIDANGTETIDGTLTRVIRADDEYIQIQSNGTEWHIVGRGDANSGTYTPTATNSSNFASFTVFSGHYLRIGDEVTVTFHISATATTSGVASTLLLSLPIASAFTSAGDAAGPVTIIGETGGTIVADAAADQARVTFTPSSTTSTSVTGSFIYTIK